ncbi:phosphatase PAP2 family protein [Niveibacterium terrae]|uniref:phosphatase PAP2 family protein n=1 Tax=Niveibacterium terrae TaxID=3373598 RepID=UPI003A8E4A4C
MPAKSEITWLAGLFAFAALAFSVFPQIDLAAARAFFVPGSGFPLGETAFAQGIYWLVWGGARLAIAAFLLLWLASLAAKSGWLRARRRWFGFMLLAIVIGPGMIVDVGLKNHWGRARPEQIRDFGGAQTFTVALRPASECARNCSFVSGHVSGVAALMSFGWLAAPARRRRWLAASIAASLLVGVVRIAQGGHFLSDVVFAWYAVWIGNALAAWLLARTGQLARGEEIPEILR